MTPLKTTLDCPRCGAPVTVYQNPLPTVDVIVETTTPQGPGIVLIERKNPPPGWALPGGFVDYGESLEQAAVREAREETGLAVELCYQLKTYSDPNRDPRHHTITTVYVGRAEGVPRAGDDAVGAAVVDPEKLPGDMAFDHAAIIADYVARKRAEATR